MNNPTDIQKEALNDVSWHVIIAAERAILTAMAGKLDDLGWAFKDVGNSTMGRELCGMAEDMTEASNMIGVATSKGLQERFDLSQQATANMISAALAVAQHKGD